jgi:hypothetical protein
MAGGISGGISAASSGNFAGGSGSTGPASAALQTTAPATDDVTDADRKEYLDAITDTRNNPFSFGTAPLELPSPGSKGDSKGDTTVPSFTPKSAAFTAMGNLVAGDQVSVMLPTQLSNSGDTLVSRGLDSNNNFKVSGELGVAAPTPSPLLSRPTLMAQVQSKSIVRFQQETRRKQRQKHLHRHRALKLSTLVEPAAPLRAQPRAGQEATMKLSATQRLLHKVKRTTHLSNNATTPLRCDPAVFMAKSWRGGWGCGGAMTRVERTATGQYVVKIVRLDALSGEPAVPSPIVASEDPSWLASSLNDAPTLSVHLTARLDEIRSQSLRTANDSGRTDPYPHHMMPASARLVAMLHRYAKLHESAAENEPRSTLCEASESRQASVWRLVSALWGSSSNTESMGGGASYFTNEDILALQRFLDDHTGLDGYTGDDPRLRNLIMQRRLAVISWLRETMRHGADGTGAEHRGAAAAAASRGGAVRGGVQPASSQGSVWEALSRLDMSSAVNLAMQSKDLRLALLVSQSSGDQSIRTVLQDQVAEWDDADWEQTADRDRVLAYLVLAGMLDDNRIPGIAELSWFQGLALHLCFNGLRDSTDSGSWICPSNGALELGLKSYEAAAKEGKVRAPAVWHQQDAAATTVGFDSLDVRYHLLRLACYRRELPVKCMTSRVSTDNPLNHAQSWHLYQALQAVGIWTPDSIKDCDNDNAARPQLLSHTQAHWITASYAAQLEDAGLWHWAIYVSLHLPESHRGEHAVRNILKRNCPSTINMSSRRRTKWEDRCRFLTEVIGIPRSAVHLAEVQRARYDRVHLAPDPWEFYQATNAKLWDSLHRNLLLHLLPQCLLQGEEHVLSSVLDVLGTETDVGRIAGWGSSGEVARMFLYLRKAVEELPHEQDETTICEHLDDIEEVLARITQKLAGDGGHIRLPPDTKEAHDVSGLRERSSCILSVCEQQIVGNIAEYRWLVAEIRKSLGQVEAEAIVMQETSPLGSLGLRLEAGSLTSTLRRLVAKWLEWNL